MISARPSKSLSQRAVATEGNTVGRASSEAGRKALSRSMERVETVLGILFGAIFVTLSVVVSIETISRKLFNFSLQGADELGGYALAVGSTLAFSVALIGRAHIRVDFLHEFFPKRVQAWLNALSILSLAAFGLFIGWTAIQVLIDTQSYGSTAPTPWATPLIYPQLVWLVALATFAAIGTVYAVRAIQLLLRGDVDALLGEFSPKSVKDEVKEEVDDLAKRQQGAQP